MSDVSGNVADQGYFWTFVVNAQECGRAEFVRKTYGAQLIINANTEVNANGEIAVSIYNPDPVAPTWEANLRVQAIKLLYRVAGSNGLWQPALKSSGDAATFNLGVCFA